jgi:YidC/Oxa1 family membrane protein insertase
VSNPFDIFLPVFVPFVEFLEAGLIRLAQFTGSGGLAIILFTIGLKIVLLWPSWKQTQSMKAMQAVAPELAALRKKYGKDRERMAREQMQLYKEHGVNPAAGCLPMIPMMIVLIGLYQALIHLSCDPSNAANIAMTYCIPERSYPAFYDSWLWITNLGAPDIPFTIGGIPIPGILPIAMLITQFAYGKLTPTTGAADDPQQQMMMRMTTYFMPIMLFFFSFNFPAGLVLYWTISNIFEILRMGLTMGYYEADRLDKDQRKAEQVAADRLAARNARTKARAPESTPVDGQVAADGQADEEVAADAKTPATAKTPPRTMSETFGLMWKGMPLGFRPLRPENLFSGLLGSPAPSSQNGATSSKRSRDDDDGESADRGGKGQRGRRQQQGNRVAASTAQESAAGEDDAADAEPRSTAARSARPITGGPGRPAKKKGKGKGKGNRR